MDEVWKLIELVIFFKVLEDEEDEPTLSTDYATEVLQPTIISSEIHCSIGKENFQQLLANTKHNILRSNSNEFNSTPAAKSTSKSCKIQKQISLYEKDKLASEPRPEHDDMELQRSPIKNIQKRWIGTNRDHTNFVSADNLQLLQSTTTLNCGTATDLVNKVAAISDETSKTKSCMNLKSCLSGGSSNPGTVVVKEKFIEPPLRVAKSFHGNTSFANKYKSRKAATVELGSGLSTDSVFTGSQTKLHRFTATLVTETDMGATNVKHSDMETSSDGADNRF